MYLGVLDLHGASLHVLLQWLFLLSVVLLSVARIQASGNPSNYLTTTKTVRLIKTIHT